MLGSEGKLLTCGNVAVRQRIALSPPNSSAASIGSGSVSGDGAERFWQHAHGHRQRLCLRTGFLPAGPGVRKAGRCPGCLYTSRKSRDVLLALQAAGEMGLKSIAFLGKGGGFSTGIATIDLLVPRAKYVRPRREDEFNLYRQPPFWRSRWPKFPAGTN